VLSLVVFRPDHVRMLSLTVSVFCLLMFMSSLTMRMCYFFAVIVVMLIFMVFCINYMSMLDFTMCMNFLISVHVSTLPMSMFFLLSMIGLMITSMV